MHLKANACARRSVVFWKEDLKAARAMNKATSVAMDDLTRESMNRFIRRSRIPSTYGQNHSARALDAKLG